jgi:hypothetical protein
MVHEGDNAGPDETPAAQPEKPVGGGSTRGTSTANAGSGG